MGEMTGRELADMFAELDDICRPSFEVSERTKRILAAQRSSIGGYQAPTINNHRVIHRRSIKRSLRGLVRLSAVAQRRGLTYCRASLAACRHLLRRFRLTSDSQ
jgi:hypothetical protein